MIENQNAGVTQKKKKYGRLKGFICFSVAAFISFSQVSPIWAAEGTRVFDEAGLFSAEEVQELETRIDEVRDTVRIIDYKSGSGTSVFTSIESLFDKEDKDRAKAVMQVFMYSWMLGDVPAGKTLQPGIYYMRTLFSDSFDAAVSRRVERMKTEPVTDFSVYSADFEAGLRRCLDEIFGQETPFVQTMTEKACAWCPFKDICGK